MLQLPLTSIDWPTPFCAFRTDDEQAIINYAVDGADSQHGAALVTLVEVRGGAARAVGAQMAVRGDGGYCGFVSGGCTEAAVAAEALQAIARSSDRYLLLGEGSPFFDIALPCGGGITLAIHVIRDPGPLRQVLTMLGKRKRVSLEYDPSAQTIVARKTQRVRTGWKQNRFTRSYRPTVRIVVFGTGLEVEATARVAAACDYEVFTFPQWATGFYESDIDQDTAVVTLFHDIDKELPCLIASFTRDPFYVGALGSKRTHERRSSVLAASGYGPELLARIKAPIGLFGPARDANSLALSIIADISCERMKSL